MKPAFAKIAGPAFAIATPLHRDLHGHVFSSGRKAHNSGHNPRQQTPAPVNPRLSAEMPQVDDAVQIAQGGRQPGEIRGHRLGKDQREGGFAALRGDRQPVHSGHRVSQRKFGQTSARTRGHLLRRQPYQHHPCRDCGHLRAIAAFGQQHPVASDRAAIFSGPRDGHRHPTLIAAKAVQQVGRELQGSRQRRQRPHQPKPHQPAQQPQPCLHHRQLQPGTEHH